MKSEKRAWQRHAKSMLNTPALSLKRILAVQIADIGDLVLTTPALVLMRRRFPEARITLLTTAHAAPIVAGTGSADDVWTFDRRAFASPRALLKPDGVRAGFDLARRLRAGRFDAIVYFHHFTTKPGALKFHAIAAAAGSPIRVGLENRNGGFLTHRVTDEGFGARHQADYWLDLVDHLSGQHFGAPRDPADYPLVTAREPFAWPPSVREGGRPLVAVHAGSGGYSLARRWPAESFAAVADRLIEAIGARIVLIGGANDQADAVRAAMQHEPIDLSGQTTLATLGDLLSACDLFIGADSGVMHLAAAAGVPIVSIFGPSNHQAWKPWTPRGRSIVLRSEPECSPCSYVGHGIGAREGCAARTCMRLVTPEGVVAAARALLDKTGAEATLTSGRKGVDPSLFYNNISVLGETETGGSKPHPYKTTMTILDLPVSVTTYDEWMAQLAAWVGDFRARGDDPAWRLHHVCTINPEMIMIARRDPIFAAILRRAALTVPDGVGLLWAAKRQGRPLPQRVTGSDGVPRIAAEAAAHGWRVFLLGAGGGVAERAAAVLRARYPALRIVGTYAGSPAAHEEAAIVEQVNASRAELLLVAYGAPEQDKWIARNTPRLRVAMAMGVGGTFDFIAGVIPRAPLAFQRAGLEWLYRLYLQPWRLRRMMRLPRFAVLALIDAGKRRDKREDAKTQRREGGI